MTRPLLQVIGLSRFFGEFQAINPVNFQINAGEIIILTGPNGCGKTTLLQCLCGLLRPTTGNVLVDGNDLYRDEVEAKKGLAYVPDVPRFYYELTTWEHLYFINLAFKVEQDWEVRAEALLNEFGMWESRNLYPHNLSRGMRLKLGILMALMRPFKVILMDEPTSALDIESVRLIREKLIMIQNNGCAILMTSHDLNTLDGLSGKIWRMERGQLEVG
jgi:ABC-2 type transport system ATP-binding protein